MRSDSFPKLCAGVVISLGLRTGSGCDRSPGGPAATPPPQQQAAGASGQPGGRELAMTRPAADGPVTGHHVRDELLEWNRQTLAGAYRAEGTHGPWDDAAVRLLDRLAVYFTSGVLAREYDPPDVPTSAELIKEARAVLDAGCDDPLVTYCYAAMLCDSGDVAGGTGPLRAAVERFEHTQYPAYRKLAAARRLLGLEADLAKRRGIYRAAEMYAHDAAAAPLSYIGRRQTLRALSEHHAGKTPKAFFQTVADLEDSHMVNADPWLVDVLTGMAHIKLGWEARGGGYANTVTPEGWKGLRHHLGLARDRLTKAWELAPELPEAPLEMITVAMGAGDHLGEDPVTWFERAVAAQSDYTDAYHRMAGGPLLPRWGGSYEEMYELGLRAARTGRYDTALPRELLGIILLIVNDADGSWEVLSQPGVYEEVCRTCDGYVRAAGPASDSGAWHLSAKAAFALRAGRLDDARRFLDELGDRVQPIAFAYARAADPAVEIAYVHASTGAGAARANAGEAAMAAGDWPAALEQFRAGAKALAPADARARPYFEARISLLERRIGLAEGRWVDLKPVGGGLTGWETRAGRWTVRAEDASISAASSISAGGALLVLGEDLGSLYQIAGRIHREGGHSGGITFTSGPETPLAHVVFRADAVEVQYKSALVHSAKMAVPPVINFTCSFDHGRLTMRVDGKAVIDGFALPEEARTKPFVGLTVLPGGRARFTNLKVRKLGADAAAQAMPGPRGRRGVPLTGREERPVQG